MNRTTLLKALLIFLFVTCHISEVTAEDNILPHGSDPAALEAPYFPNRMYTLVWRNWNVVTPSKIAEILGTSAEKVESLAASMGLPPAGDIPPEMKTRGYITIIRRNWHLLPYDQLLQLLEMTPQQLAIALREDDFLWIKLGSLKPKCEPLHYSEPDEASRRRAAEIKQVVEEEFGAALLAPAEPRFRFVEELSKASPAARVGKTAKTTEQKATDTDQIRFIYSYFGVFGDPLSAAKIDPYPDGLLERLSALGVNGVWLHVVLRDLAPGGEAFPEFGEGHERRLRNLNALVERARKYGIGVYLYINEPRAMPRAFFEKEGRKDMAGVSEGDFTALCTSNPKVRKWMHDALSHVFRKVPHLAGVFAITASENLTNCASHGKWRSCHHCKNRSYADVIADASNIIKEGVLSGNPQAKVILYDWGWHGHGNSPDVIAKLPKPVWLMSVSEWALSINRGANTKVGEYSISAVGPGPRATLHWKLAKQAGLKTMAKVQLNNSWELSSVPYLPVMDLVAKHCHNLASADVDGMMLSWSLGGYPSPNLEIAARLQQKPTPSVDSVLDVVATERFGPEGAPFARKAWGAFSRAFQQYPFHCSVIYSSPVQVGPANPIFREKTKYSATMTGIPYDDLAAWRGPYPAEVFASQFEKVAASWRAGIPDLQTAVEKASPECRQHAEEELRIAQAACANFQSVANQSRFIIARDILAKSSSNLLPQENRRLKNEIQQCLKSEIALAKQLFQLTSEDSRIGFEAANQYFYLPLDLVEKVINCRFLLLNAHQNHFRQFR